MTPARPPGPILPSARATAGRALLALLLAAAPGALPAYAASAFVPADHRAYPQVEAWEARGVLPPTLLGARPYTWERLARMLARARPTTAADRTAVAALEAEARGHVGTGWHATPSLTLATAEGRPVRYVRPPGINAGGPLAAFDAGATYREHFGGDARLRTEARWRDRVAVLVEPRAAFGDAGGGNPGLQEGYISLDLGPLLLAAGRQAFVWGPAPTGGYLMTANAAPIPALRLGLAEPHAFSGGWAWLGTVDFAWFLSRLETDRAVPRPYLTGLRLMWMPTARLELGASRTIMLGGEGQPDLSWSDLMTILGGRNLYGNADTSNSIAGVDAAWRLPLTGPVAARIYGEYAGEDEANQLHLPTKPAVRAGLLVAGLGPKARCSLRAEFAATDVFYDHAKWGHDFWYAHGIYRSGHTYRGRILGDPMGADARAARAGLFRDTARGRAGATLEWLAVRFSDPEREDHWRLGGLWEAVMPGSPARVEPARVEVDGRVERVTFDDARAARWQSLVLVRLSLPFGRTAPDGTAPAP